MEISSPINHAMLSQLAIMEHFAHDLLSSLNEAQKCLESGERNGAIGALLCCQEGFESLKVLYDSIMVMHRNAILVEHPND